MPDPLDDAAREAAALHALDPLDLARRARRQLARRIARGQPDTRRCLACGAARPTAQFGTDPRARDGLRTTCRDCRSRAARAHRRSVA